MRGRLRGDLEHFARIPVSLLESEAVVTLNHAAFRVLVILASQFRGRCNGNLALTERFARPHGFRGRDTLYRSLRELESRGLIVCTRRGMKIKNSFSLYALGWLEITHRNGRPLDRSEPPNNSAWLNWRKSVPTDGKKSEIQTDSRESLVPTVGNGHGDSVPMGANRSGFLVPTVRNTLRISAHGANERAQNAGASGVSNSLSKVEKLLTEMPGLSDQEIARMLAIAPEQVRSARNRLGTTSPDPRAAQA